MTQPLIQSSQIQSGTSADDVLVLNGSAQIPAVDGSLLTGVVAANGADVSKVGTPVDNQLGVWTGDGTLEGTATLTWDGTTFLLDSATATTIRVEGGTNSDPRVSFYQNVNIRGIVGFDDSENAMAIQAQANDIVLRPSDTTTLTISSTTGLDLAAGGIRLLERADHAFTPTATFGELWLRSDAANAIIFTSDASVDHNLIVRDLHQASGGTITSATDIDPNAGHSFEFTFGAAATAEIGFSASDTAVAEMTVEITNGGQGTLTWGVEVEWAGGVAPTLTAAGTDILKFFTRDSGTTVRGWVVALDVS